MRDALKAGAVLVALGSTATPLSAQSASDIVGRMLEAYQERSEGVENYTIVQDAMGLESRAYFEKEMVDGRPVFRLQRTTVGPMASDGAGQSVDEIYSIGEELGRLAEYEGVERVENYEVHVLRIPDLSATEFGRNVTADSEFVPVSGRIYLDVDSYAPRRLVFEGEMTAPSGEIHPVTSQIDMGDYREIEGMLFPFRTAVTIEGLGAAIDPEMRAQFEEMQRELEEMPEAQRRMVESMMAEQLEQFRALMEGEETGMSVTVLVRQVLVNQGPGA